MLLQELLKYIPNVHWIRGRIDIEVKGFTYDYTQVAEDFLYVAVEEYLIHNIWIDGHKYLQEAIQKGANSIIMEKDIPLEQGDHPYTCIRIADTKKALSLIADKFYGYPLSGMKVIGVTGTNGKTTTTHLIKSIFKAAGYKTGVVGTVGYFIGNEKQPAIYTTPLSSDLFRLAASMRDQGVEVFIMEASSHGIALDRTYGIDYDVAVLTNVTRDHLDYHGTVEEYRKAKMRLFQQLGAYEKEQALGVINADDPAWSLFVEATQVPTLTYGIQNSADIQGYDLHLKPMETFFKIKIPSQLGYSSKKDLEINLKILGLFNVYNVLAATTVGLSQGLDLEAIKEGVEHFTSIEGRFEMIDCGQEFPVIVDYAHSPDALETILKTARAVKTRKLITVFGCGGDKDKGKRPIMGAIGTTFSDYCIITSDNPRTEDPLVIIKEIEAGIDRGTACPFESIVDRREAIEKALSYAQPGDVVVLAGKGHEDYQIIGNKKIPFSDKEEVKKFFAKKFSSLTKK